MGTGASVALIEDLVVDELVGFFVRHDLAGYEVPCMWTSRTTR